MRLPLFPAEGIVDIGVLLRIISMIRSAALSAGYVDKFAVYERLVVYEFSK